MLKKLFQFLIILAIGFLGGFLSVQFKKPPAETPPPIIKKEEIIIQENTALTNAIDKVQNSIVAIGFEKDSKKLISESGVILTNDGLILTLASLVPAKPLVFFDNEKLEAKIIKRDFKNNLALLKIEKTNLPTAKFGSLEKTKLGQRVFLIGKVLRKETLTNFVNEGIIKNFDKDFLQTNMTENVLVNAAPLFNIEAEMLGLNFLDNQGRLITISIEKIKAFTGF